MRTNQEIEALLPPVIQEIESTGFLLNVAALNARIPIAAFEELTGLHRKTVERSIWAVNPRSRAICIAVSHLVALA